MTGDRKPNDYNNLPKDPILFKRLLKCLRQFKLDFGKVTSHMMEHPALFQIF